MDLMLHVSAYDINCQYCINHGLRMEDFWGLRERTEALKVIPKKRWPFTLWGVGKFHARAHNKDCRTKWGFNFLPWSTMADGEASERVWPSVNSLSPRTREMNPGNRQETINKSYGDQNIRKVHNMCTIHVSNT